MSEDKVTNLPRRGSIDDPLFQRCLKMWRAFAHRRGLVVGSPVRLIGAEKTIYGDSDNMTEGAASYLLSEHGGLGVSVGDLWLTDKEREMLGGIVAELDDRADVDIATMRAPVTEEVEILEDERDRWEILVENRRRIGTVVRVGEGSKKHYLLYLWIGGGFRLVTGQPCFDLPMFGLPEVRSCPDLPVMIHEGPKAWDMAQNRMDGWVHVAWHGSEWGMEWTDWTPLRGRRVLIWPDVDEAGLANARNLGRRLARMGGVVEYVNWSAADIERFAGWDWADDGGFSSISAGDIRKRTSLIESPTTSDGSISWEWARRSFLDLAKLEVYQVSTNFQPVALSALAVGEGKFFREKVVKSVINPYVGLDYRPGITMGRMADGKINVCPPGPRDFVAPRPLDRGLYRELRIWLSSMIPDVAERKHLIKRAAWAAARPERIPQHMVVLKGDSSVGKSVLLDLIAAVSGRGVTLSPSAILSNFNAQIAYKSVVCVPEIHANDLSRRQNTGLLKELIANQHIQIEEKNRPKITMTNVIHWFAATNEQVPFTLEHGNDRFYFVQCVVAKNPARMRRFFNKWVSRFQKDETLMDDLNAGAKYLVEGFKETTEQHMVGRAQPQAIWDVIKRGNRQPWFQLTARLLEDIYDQEPEGGRQHPPVFVGQEIVARVTKDHRRVGEDDVRRAMNELGFCMLKRVDGGNVQRRVRHGRVSLWCKASDMRKLQAREEYGSLTLNTLISE